MKREEPYTIREIMENLTPILTITFSSHAMHFLEEIGEVASVIMRNQDPIIPEFGCRISEAVARFSIIKDEPRWSIKLARYSEFYRWNEKFVGEKFKQKLGSELADIIVMIAIYPFLAQQKGFELREVEDLLDTIIVGKKYFNDPHFTLRRISSHFAQVYDYSVFIDDAINANDNQSSHECLTQSLTSLLIWTIVMFGIFEIDITQAIHEKLHGDLKQEHRSKVKEK